VHPTAAQASATWGMTDCCATLQCGQVQEAYGFGRRSTAPPLLARTTGLRTGLRLGLADWRADSGAAVGNARFAISPRGVISPSMTTTGTVRGSSAISLVRHQTSLGPAHCEFRTQDDQSTPDYPS
jgi:hypothetical protein